MEKERVEKWLPVVGYEGLYEVSDLGRVRSLDRATKSVSGIVRNFPGVTRKPCIDRRGYLTLGLRNPRESPAARTHFVHRLVMLAFVGPHPVDKPHVNHKNFCRTDNSLENLEWVSNDENIQHAWSAGRMHPALGARVGVRYTLDTVNLVRSLGADKSLSGRAIAEISGVPGRTVDAILRGDTWNVPGAKGTARRRVKTPFLDPGIRKKLTPSDVSEIRNLLNNHGAPRGDVAKKFSVHLSTIRKIHRGETWKPSLI